MLENLEKVEWEKYGHAYGVATDVPELIRKIAQEPPILQVEDREDSALDQLMNAVFHQGTVYSSTIQVIPFFIELLTYDSVQNKVSILATLQGMLEVLFELDWDLENYTSEELSEFLNIQKEFLETIEKGKDTYLKLTVNEDSEIRKGAKELLSLLAVCSRPPTRGLK